MSDTGLRKEIIAAANAMNQSGLSPGKSGNVSARDRAGHILITPTGVPYADLKPGDIVALDNRGKVLSGSLLPSSEWHFHVAIYTARTDVNAIVHTHSLHATALACAHREIPAFHYMVAVAGGDNIRCAPYATFGTDELAHHALAALEGRNACLLANHGQIALGETPAKALAMAHEVETLASQYVAALQIGQPTILDTDEMARVLEKFKTYGQQVKR
ncbi:MAG: class II aldolase/adducin family protein [Pseudomonadota bacterium]